jgi:hypothetical protein
VKSARRRSSCCFCAWENLWDFFGDLFGHFLLKLQLRLGEPGEVGDFIWGLFGDFSGFFGFFFEIFLLKDFREISTIVLAVCSRSVL